MKIAKMVAIPNSIFSELLNSILGDNMMKVPITIAIPGKESAKIFADEVRIIESESRHFIITLTRIKGEIYLNKSVNAANGHNNSGEVDAKCTAQSAMISAKPKRTMKPTKSKSLDLCSVALCITKRKRG